MPGLRLSAVLVGSLTWLIMMKGHVGDGACALGSLGLAA